MDDPSKNQQNPQPQTQASTIVSKEAEPILRIGDAEAYVKLSETEPSIPKEVSEAGVKAVSQEHPIPQDVREAGLDLAKEAQAPSLEPTLKVPMTQTQAQKSSKGSVSESITWLSTLIMLLFKKDEQRGEVK